MIETREEKVLNSIVDLSIKIFSIKIKKLDYHNLLNMQADGIILASFHLNENDQFQFKIHQSNGELYFYINIVYKKKNKKLEYKILSSKQINLTNCSELKIFFKNCFYSLKDISIRKTKKNLYQNMNFPDFLIDINVSLNSQYVELM